MERLKNMGLKKSFLLLSLSCLAVAFLLLGAVIFLCRGIENHYPLGGVEILSNGSVVPLPSPTVSQQRILATLNIVQTVSCILFPVGGLIVSVFLFYYLKLKQPISCLQNGIMRIQNNDLDFSLPILSNDEMGQLCAAFEEMRSELLKSNRLLWQQTEERKRLNAAFSHDLRNPITVLKGSVKLLRQGIQDEQTIDRLESYTLRIEQYVKAMSSVQKLEQLSVKPKEIRLSVLQSELQETARLLALSKKVSVLVPSGGTVCIDHGLFLTVAENLIGNAARFAEKAISIQITLQNDSMTLNVEDDGAGYPLSLVQNGPTPFETTSSNSSHFGMGLYSSRILCEKHGGRLILEKSGRGRCIRNGYFSFCVILERFLRFIIYTLLIPQIRRVFFMNIEAKNLSKIYGDGENRVVALNRANLEIVSSDFISIMGPSGSGKSTLLHLISGLDKPSSGSLTYDGKDIYSYSDKELSAFRRKRIGFIFQQFNLLPVLTAKENIIMPLLLDKQKPDEAYLKQLTELLGIQGRLEHLPHELSGGQQQRVAIARALIAKPDVIFADEPTGNLDSKSGGEVMELLQNVWKKMGKALVVITHDNRIARMADRQFQIVDGVLTEVTAK